MIIYLITNNINGKKYVGQTTTSLEQRWAKHCVPSAKYCRLLHNAIRKYGKESFTVSLLAEADSKEELDRKEIHFINSIGTLAPKGYNLLSGGSFGRHSEETKLKMSKSRTGKRVPALSRKRGSYSVEWCSNISKAKKGNNGLRGIKRGFIPKPTMRLPVIGTSIFNGSTIEFDSIKSASEYFGKSHSNIVANLRKRKASAYGYKWEYKQINS